MTRGQRTDRAAQRGVAMLIALAFLMLFSCLAVAVATSADTNLTVARNRQASHRASALAEVGLQLAQVNLASGLHTPGGDDAAALHAAVANQLKSAWAGSTMVDTNQIHSDADGVDGIHIALNGGSGVPAGTIDMRIYVSSYAPHQATTVTVESTGASGSATRTVHYNMTVQTGRSALSAYGIASRSPIVFTGNARITGATDSHGIAHPENGSILSAAYSTAQPIKMTGNCSTTGTASVCNPSGNVKLVGNCTIGGGVVRNAPEPEWPVVDVSVFRPYIQSTYRGNGSGNLTLSNIRIPANTNPTFSGNTTIKGIIYVEAPNKITFSGNTVITGIIACETPPVDSLTANQLKFTGNLTVNRVSSLPADSQYDGLRDQTGTFLLAPGYSTQFTGNFNAVSGCMVASEFKFTGNAAGRVSGGIVNLRDSDFQMAGNANIAIDREFAEDNPAGIVSSGLLKCVAGSYWE